MLLMMHFLKKKKIGPAHFPTRRRNTYKKCEYFVKKMPGDGGREEKVV